MSELSSPPPASAFQLHDSDDSDSDGGIAQKTPTLTRPMPQRNMSTSSIDSVPLGDPSEYSERSVSHTSLVQPIEPLEEEVPALYLPGIMATHLFQPIPNTDPLTTLLTKYVPNAEMRPVRDITGDWQHTEFHSLVMSNSWRALARMARDRIVSSNPSDVANILSLWNLRLSCLARLRLMNQTAAETTNLFNALASIEPFAHRDYLYNVLLPFDLELMKARLKYWAGDLLGYLDELNAIERQCRVSARRCRSRVEEIKPEDVEAEVEMWKERASRVGLIIASQLIEMKQYAAATKLLAPLIAPGRQPSFELRSAIARMYLQAGDMRSAAIHFAYVNALPCGPEDIELANMKILNHALTYSAEGKWAEAAEQWQLILAQDPGDPVANNNLAIALLNTGKLQEAIRALEAALHASPATVVVAEPFLFNLATLYELRSGTALEKKRDLLIEAAKWSGDGLKASCLKLPNSGLGLDTISLFPPLSLSHLEKLLERRDQILLERWDKAYVEEQALEEERRRALKPPPLHIEKPPPLSTMRRDSGIITPDSARQFRIL